LFSFLKKSRQPNDPVTVEKPSSTTTDFVVAYVALCFFNHGLYTQSDINEIREYFAAKHPGMLSKFEQRLAEREASLAALEEDDDEEDSDGDDPEPPKPTGLVFAS
jgi:hypothetical protein